MKPSFTPCFSRNRSLYWLRISMTDVMSTSLKVDSRAYVFCAPFSRSATRCLRRVIFTRLSGLGGGAPGTRPLPASAAGAAGLAAAGAGVGGLGAAGAALGASALGAAGLAAGAAGAAAAAVAPAVVSSEHTSLPTCTTSCSLMCRAVTVPASFPVYFTSMVTLSVSICAMMSFSLTRSPGFLRMFATVPSDTDSPIAGTFTSMASWAHTVDRNHRACVAAHPILELADC
mmetsp:Transcript_34789/g.88124  ORF Transcript_34789/g.88124 Transcript_34789/m.88124 type:complete len:230 (+) Transcript_34789:1017-1706(+)